MIALSLVLSCLSCHSSPWFVSSYWLRWRHEAQIVFSKKKKKNSNIHFFQQFTCLYNILTINFDTLCFMHLVSRCSLKFFFNGSSHGSTYFCFELKKGGSSQVFFWFRSGQKILTRIAMSRSRWCPLQIDFWPYMAMCIVYSIGFYS